MSWFKVYLDFHKIQLIKVKRSRDIIGRFGIGSERVKYDMDTIRLILEERNRIKNTGDYIRYERFPQEVIQSLVLIEDKRFRKHRGIDLIAILRAFCTNLMNGQVKEGGSTLTQQLVRLCVLSNKKKLSRKIKEAYLALVLERHMKKEEIIEMYLNKAYFGRGASGHIFGISWASRQILNKEFEE